MCKLWQNILPVKWQKLYFKLISNACGSTGQLLNSCFYKLLSCANQTCNDGNNCITGETYDVNCNCGGGIFEDTDNDGVCDANDICPSGDDNIDNNSDNVPDACYVCPNAIVDMNNPGISSGREANVSISTNGKVLSGVNVEYHAGQQIEMMSNFEVEPGAEFKAYIAPCD